MIPPTSGLRATQPRRGYLPDFCANQVVFLLVLIAELLALVLTLTTIDELADFWIELGLISLLIQSVALGSVVVLCPLGTWLARRDVLAATLTAYGLIQLVTLLFTLLAAWIMNLVGSELMASDLRSPQVLFRILAISSIVSLAALRYLYVHHQWKHNVEAEARARLQALQARIRPHFLFNSMNTVASLIRDAPEQAEEAVLDLADLFRTTVAQPERIPLGDELETARRYLRIEKLRLGERLQVDWQVDERLPLAMPIPALILQPLLENAVYYGVQPLTGGGRIRIHIEVRDRRVLFSIVNPLPTAEPHGHRIAQDNVRQRLALAYGGRGHMEIRETGALYVLSFSIPLEPEP